MKKNRVTLLNIITSIILQIVTILSGFIIPKIVLLYFGSNVNGLITSLGQMLSYISLIEGGVTGVISASLYKPLVDKDDKKLSSIIKTTNIFYRKIGILFTIYAILLSIVYPLVVKTRFSYIYILSISLILSMSLFVQYMFSLTMRNLLMADKKAYIIYITQTITTIVNVLCAIISIKVYPSIHLLKGLTGILFLVQPLVYGLYIKKHYNILRDVKPDNNLLKSRWNGFAINVAAFIHFSTDVTILTLFTNLKMVSVYCIYSLVVTGLRQLICAVCDAITPTIGQAYAKKNIKELNEKMDVFEYITFIIVFLAFVVAGLLITPFVMIYTSNIHDANYYQPIFGILILLSEGLYLIKTPHLNLAYSANKFKEITIPSYIEAGLNIFISIILVSKIGICGVAIGTIIAMLYRLIFQIDFTKKIIKGRKPIKFYKTLIIFVIASIVGIIINLLIIPKVDYNIFSWIKSAIIYSIVMIIIYYIVSKVFMKKELNYIKNYMKK